MLRFFNSKKTLFLSLMALACYLLLARIGIYIAMLNSTTAPIWPATGFAIAFLYTFGWRHWPAVFIGAFLANTSGRNPLAADFFFAVGSVIEALVGSFLLRTLRYDSGHTSSLDIKTPVLAVGVAALVAPIASAVSGTSTLAFFGTVSWSAFGVVWLTWWLGNALGILFIFPVMHSFFRWLEKKNFEGLSSSVVFFVSNIMMGLVASYFIFETEAGKPYAFLYFPLLLFSALSSGDLGLKTLTLTICSFGMFETTYGMDPLSGGNLNEGLFSLQIFMFSVGITSLALTQFRSYLHHRAVILFLLVGWLLSGTVFYSFYLSKREIAITTFDDMVRSTSNTIRRRLSIYQNVLKSGAALFLSSNNVTEHDWKNFISALDVINRYPGVSSFGFTRPIKRSQLREFEKKRQKSNPRFSVKPLPLDPGSEPLPPSSEAYVLEYLEPANEKALGADLSSERARRFTAEASRDSGLPQISQNLVLVPESDSRRPGFLFMLPFYKGGAKPDSVAERREKFYGWIVGAFVFDDLLEGIRNVTSHQVDFFIFPEGEVRKEKMIYQSSPLINVPENIFSSNHYRLKEIKFGGRVFSVLWKKNASFSSDQNTTLMWLGAFGALMTLISTWMYIHILIYRERAEVLVDTKTKELSERELLWRTLMGTTPGGIIQTNQEGFIKYANSMLTEMTGLDLSKPKKFNWVDLVHPEDRDNVLKNWKLKMRNGETFHTQFRFRNSKEETRWADAFLSKIITESGKSLGYVGLMIDVTERIRIQAEREAEQTKLAQASKMASLGEMAGGIAHEINNPLAIILGKSAQIKRQFGGGEKSPEPEKVLQGLSKIEDTVGRIARIVRGLRTFSRNAENDPMERTTVYSVIEDSLSLCDEKLKEKEVRLFLDVQDAPIFCRAAQISQVLLNLLNNSFDAVENLSEKWIRIESRVTETSVIILVIDSGKGILPEVEKKMMEPFFTTKEVGKGTGLGLSISKKIVEDHGGTFSYQKKDTRTCFIIQLPKA